MISTESSLRDNSSSSSSSRKDKRRGETQITTQQYIPCLAEHFQCKICHASCPVDKVRGWLTSIGIVRGNMQPSLLGYAGNLCSIECWLQLVQMEWGVPVTNQMRRVVAKHVQATPSLPMPLSRAQITERLMISSPPSSGNHLLLTIPPSQFAPYPGSPFPASYRPTPYVPMPPIESPQPKRCDPFSIAEGNTFPSSTVPEKRSRADDTPEEPMIQITVSN